MVSPKVSVPQTRDLTNKNMNEIQYSFATSCQWFLMFCYTPEIIHLWNSLANLLKNDLFQNYRAIRSNNR